MKRNARTQNNLLNILLLTLGVSCNHRITPFRQASFWSSPPDQIAKCSLTIPRKCNCTYLVEEDAIEKIYLYGDSSFIFIRKGSPGEFPSDAIIKYGTNLPMKFTYVKDTLSISGEDKYGRYWEVRNQNYFIYGYQKVQAKRKALFDSALNSISINFVSQNSKEESETYWVPGSVIDGYYEVKCKRF